jgi:YVTN family beta-propeller protein
MIRLFFFFLALFIQQKGLAYYTYVINSGGSSVSVVDFLTNSVFKTIEVGNSPSFSAITPDKNYIYVPNSNDDTVSIIDTIENIVIGTENVLGSPFFATITPDGSSAYIACEGGVSVINTSNQKNIANIPLDFVCTQVLFSPNGEKAYVLTPDNVIEIDTSSNQVSNTSTINAFDLGQYPNLIAITSDGETIYSTNFYDNQGFPMYAINTENLSSVSIPLTGYVINPTISLSILPNQKFIYASGNFNDPQNQNYYVYVIETSTNTVSNEIFISNVTNANIDPPVLIATLDGEKIYTSNYGSDEVYFINTIDNSVSAPITTSIQNPNFPTLTDDGAFVYLCGTDGAICSINVSTNEVSDPIPVGASPNCIIIIPPPKPVSNLMGFQKTDSYITQKETYNFLSWAAPINGIIPVSYRIYRNSNLTDLAAITNSFSFIDHNRIANQTYTYYVVSVANNGDFSTPAIITISPI